MTEAADVLVIDDDPGMCETLGDLLQQQGHRVRTADRGRVALERMMQPPPVDLAIVDFKLPDVSGLDLLRRIKEQSPETEVILITGYASLSSALEAINGEASAYLVKPLDVGHLLTTIDKALAKHRSARALRESEERYRLVTETMTEAIFLLDLEGQLLMGNPYGETLTGYRQDEMRGRPVFSLLTPESARQAKGRLEAVRAGREVSPRFQMEFVHKDGGHIWAEVCVSSVVDHGRVVGRLGVARDITAQKRAEEVADALAQLGRDPVGTLDFAHIAERVVAGAWQVFRGRRAVLYAPDPTSGMLVCVAAAGDTDSRNCIGWRFPADVGLAGRAVSERRVVSSSGPASARIELPEDADERLLEDALPGNVAGALIARGAVVGVLVLGAGRERALSEEDLRLFGVFADHAALALYNGQLFAASERRRKAAERLGEVANLVSQSLRIENVAQQIADSVFTILDARIAALYRLEPESEALAVVAVSAVSEAPQSLLCRGTTLPPSVGAVSLAIRERRVVVSPDVLADSQISISPELREAIEQISYRAVLAVPLLVQDRVVGALGVGHRVGVIFSDEDIQLLRAFADHAAVALENERLYGDLRAALEGLKASQERLVEAERMQAVGALAGGVTDYANNVFQAILGRIQLVLRRLQDIEVRQALEVTERTIHDAAAVFRRLQSVSEIETLSAAQQVDLNALVRDAVETTRPDWEGDAHARSVGIQLVREMGRVPGVPGQPMALLEVLSSFLLNAVDALPAGGKIAIKTWASERWVHCAIADSGLGMSEDVRHRAVEPFFTTKGPERKGLGLSVAYGVIRRHRGEMEISSAEGRGTTVTIRLPREAWRQAAHT